MQGGFWIIVVGNALTWLIVGMLLVDPTVVLSYRLEQIIAWIALVAAAFRWVLE